MSIASGPILVVDDDPKIVRLVRTYLEREGFEVETASDGPGALEAIERLAPALVVLDLMLPRLDGHGVMRAVRADEVGRSIPSSCCRQAGRRSTGSPGSSTAQTTISSSRS